jgi:hypothetical protein
MIGHTVGRVLDHFGIEADLVRRWGERAARPTNLPMAWRAPSTPVMATTRRSGTGR